MTDTNEAPAKKAKAPIPTATFETELVSGSVQSLIKAAGATASKANEGGVVRFKAGDIRRIDGFNLRVETPDYRAHIDDLKASMKSEGYYADKPMAGYAAKDGDTQVLFLTDGYTRLTAVEELIAEGADGFDDEFTIPVIIKPQTQTLEDLTVALVLGNEGRTLTVYEKALAVKRLINMGLTNAQVQQRLNMSDRYVLDLIVLAGAPAKVRNLVVSGKVSATEAIKQLKKDAGKAGAKLEQAAKAASAKGKKRATGKDVSDDGDGEGSGGGEKKTGGLVESKVSTRNGKVTETLTYRFKQGEIVEKDAIMPVARFHDMEYWSWVDEKTKEHAVIEESIQFIVTITTDEPVDQEADEAADETFEAITDQSGGEGDEEGDEGDAQDAEDGSDDAEDGETEEDASTGEESGSTAEEDDGEL